MNTEKRINEAMEQIKTRIRQKQEDIKESEECLTKYKEDKVTCAFNKMAIACWKEEINALREIYTTLSEAKIKRKEIRITFYDLNKNEFEENKERCHEYANHIITNKTEQALIAWYWEKAGIILHKIEGYMENWYYYTTKDLENRYVYEEKKEYRDKYGSWQPIE